MTCIHNWELAQPLPKEDGEHTVLWKCKKCGLEEASNVLVRNERDRSYTR